MLLVFFVFAILVILSSSSVFVVHGLNMDVKCTVYQHTDDENGDNVDVRTLVMGLKETCDYTPK